MKCVGMAASDSNMFSTWFIIFAVFFLHVSLVSVSSQTVGRVRGYEGKGIIRSRRQACAHGTYDHDNRKCCLCGAGQKLKEHCTASVNDRQCEFCESGTYSSHPNAQPTCEPCTSCSHPNANLEEREPCQPGRDTKCRCKEHHYCSSGTEENCRICNPCKECDNGIKISCTGTNDTVCNDKSEGGNLSIVIPIVIISILILAVIVFVFVFVVLRRRKRQQTENITQPTKGRTDENEMELHLLRGVDPLPHLPDISQVLGWKDMEAVAIRSGMQNAAIEACQLDSPGDSQEQTLQLLIKWVEREGKDALSKLIQTLQNSGKRGKAEKVADILSRSHVSA